MFGYAPRLRNQDRERDTPSVRWDAELLLETGAARSEQVLGERSAQAQKVCSIANLAIATLNNRLGEALPGNTFDTEVIFRDGRRWQLSVI